MNALLNTPFPREAQSIHLLVVCLDGWGKIGKFILLAVTVQVESNLPM